MTAMMERPSLGQSVGIGCLYDARSDKFLDLSLLLSPLHKDALKVDKKHTTNVKYGKSEKLRDKFDLLNLGPELSASVLADLTSVSGTGRYLAENNRSNQVSQYSMCYSINTVDEEVQLMSYAFKDNIAPQVLQTAMATHVVLGIRWGAQCVITARQQMPVDKRNDESIEILRERLEKLNIVDIDEFDDEMVNIDPDEGENLFEEHDKTDDLEYIIYSPCTENNLVHKDFESAQRTFQSLAQYVEDTNDGKGVPVSYCLAPLNLLVMVQIIETQKIVPVYPSNVECLEKFIGLFDSLLTARHELEAYDARVRKYTACLPGPHIKAVKNQLRVAQSLQTRIKSDFCKRLKDVRSGVAGAEQLWELFYDHDCSRNKKPFENLTSIMVYGDEIDFMDLVQRNGGRYIGFRTAYSLGLHINQSEFEDIYVFYFSKTSKESISWSANLALFTELLETKQSTYEVIAVNCDSNSTKLANPHISQYRNKKVLVQDMVEHRKVLSENCIMQYNPEELFTTSKDKPFKRRAIKLPCPNLDCDQTLQCAWICSRCEGVVEYGYSDNRLYCDCGSCPYSYWQFKCKDDNHGLEWAQYVDSELEEHLKALKPIEELNILILGETGVGKSTWINAFVNYITHDTLEDALENSEEGGLKWVVPFSFATQQTDENGKFVQKEIKLGIDDTENDGSSGNSATQQTKVYAVEWNKTRVRLIDTPGIGDTRGLDRDNENMVDILRVLRSYNNLHGILILLKPNAARLTVMFRFCVKQLLTHLHRNAAKNIVFGFTNTRGSNYMPGDTFKPLESLLNEYNEVKIGLYEHNVYCFDSESFRYLAAKKRGIDMGHLEDNRRSWEYSVGECRRLVKHFQGLTPHEVRNTINLNETRDMILRMTEPMTLISQKIQATIDVNEDELAEVRNRELTRGQLMKKLYVPIESLESVPVRQPRTVCAHSSCVEVRSDFEGRMEQTIVYKTLCHNPCYLSGVPARTKGDPALQHCACVGSGGLCTGCGHSWADHMHIYVEYKPKTYRMTDAAIKRDIGDHATKIEVQKKVISLRENKIIEFKLEYAQMQEAAIQFGFFLKRHAITPYNDATLEYIDVLIDQERIKVGAGGDPKTLEKLKEHRLNHQEKVKILSEAIARGENHIVLNDQGVHQTIKGLYGLPNFGKDLEDIVTGNEKAADACYRERTFNVYSSSRSNSKRQLKIEAPKHNPVETITELGEEAAPVTPKNFQVVQYRAAPQSSWKSIPKTVMRITTNILFRRGY